MKKDHQKTCYVIGNWKMQGSHQHAIDFFEAWAKEDYQASQVQTAVCPSFPYLEEVAKLIKTHGNGMGLGAQDVSACENGAYTGQVSADMLRENHCEYVIVGHSERRQYCHENDEIVAKKFLMAQKKGLIPILCVGETLAQREEGKTESVVLSQMQDLLTLEPGAIFSRAMIAYEPIWAIGTGQAATPEQAQAVHHLLREALAEYDATLAAGVPLLYGGSVKPGNAEALFAMQDINGALVGGASLSASDFIALCRAGAKCTE